MVDNENRDNGHKDGELVPMEDGVALAQEVKPAVRPDGLTDKQVADIQEQASKAVTALVNATGSEAFTVGDSIANVGIQDQKLVSTGVSLLQEKIGNMFYGQKKSETTQNITKDISNLQDALAKINPKDIQKEARFKIIRYLPFFGNWMVGVLKESDNRRLTLQEFIEHLETSLQSGELILKQDNAQMKVMAVDLESKQKTVSADAYYAEVLMEKLSEAIGVAKDEHKRGQLQKVLFRVATRAQDLRAMEHINGQFFVSIEMTRDNNDMLIATVQRMLTMGMNAVCISLVINAALKRQTDVLGAAVGTRDFLGKLILRNASLINSHAKEIGDLYKEPIVAMDMLQKAVEQLEQAIDATNKLKIESIEQDKKNIVVIRDLTEELKTKAGTLPDTDVRSLEASKMLQLPVGRS